MSIGTSTTRVQGLWRALGNDPEPKRNTHTEPKQKRFRCDVPRIEIGARIECAWCENKVACIHVK